MKIVAKLDNGNLLAEVPADIRERITAMLRIAAGDLIQSVMEVLTLSVGDATEAVTDVAEGATAAAAKPVESRRKAITHRPAPTTKKGRYDRENSLIGQIRGIMADGSRRSIRQATEELGLDVNSHADVDRVTKTLATYKKEFERVAKGVYRRIGAPKVRTLIVPVLAADPTTLTDEELSQRLRAVASAGQQDQAARLEFIKRKSSQ